jgi:hypothetical protein
VVFGLPLKLESNMEIVFVLIFAIVGAGLGATVQAYKNNRRIGF